MRKQITPQCCVFALGIAFSLVNLLALRGFAIPWVLFASPIVVFMFFFFIRQIHPSEVSELATELWMSYLITGFGVIGLQWLFHF